MAYAVHDNATDKSRSASAVSEPAHDLAEKASQQLGKAVEKAETTVRQVAERGSEAGEQMQEVATNLKSAVNKSVKDQPMATLAVAALMGFALGALWKS